MAKAAPSGYNQGGRVVARAEIVRARGTVEGIYACDVPVRQPPWNRMKKRVKLGRCLSGAGRVNLAS